MNHRTIAAPLLLLFAAGCNQADAPAGEPGGVVDTTVDVTDVVMEAAAPETRGPFAPREECRELSGAEPFLAALNAAVALRDTDLLVALSAQDIKLGFGGQDGVANLRAALSPPDQARPASSSVGRASAAGAREEPVLWGELEELLELGCAVNGQGGITLPYYFAQESGLDPFEAFIVTADRASLRSEPEAAAPELADVAWQEVGLVRNEQGQPSRTGGENGAEWTEVRLPASGKERERKGWVRTDTLRSMVDYRLLAASRNGRWRIVSLLAGD